MKKFCLLLCFCLCLLGFAGCTKQDVYAVMSEQTKVYFYGEGENGNVSIAVGQREKDYIVDGKSGENCDFSLITLNLNGGGNSDRLSVKVFVGDKEEQLLLELNPLNMSYMGDLGYAIKEEEQVKVAFLSQEIMLENISAAFEVDWKNAIKIGYDAIEEKENFKSGNLLTCEGYLKVLDGKSFGGKGLHWCFTLVSENNISQNILIDVYDKNVVFMG